MHSWFHTLKYAARLLRAARGFSAMTTEAREILMTTEDNERLRAMLESHDVRGKGAPWQLRTLERELERAKVVPPHKMPPDVVTMNSTVRVRGGGRDEADTWTIVYPEDTDLDQGRISVLSPMGLAILGYRAGDEVSWELPTGPRRFTIEEVIQPPRPAGQVKT